MTLSVRFCIQGIDSFMLPLCCFQMIYTNNEKMLVRPPWCLKENVLNIGVVSLSKLIYSVKLQNKSVDM